MSAAFTSIVDETIVNNDERQQKKSTNANKKKKSCFCFSKKFRVSNVSVQEKLSRSTTFEKPRSEGGST